MRGTRTVLASGFLALVLITGSSAPSAADDCLAKPNEPTPQGQHWYYRIDHANNGRQCWYLRAEIGRVQKNARQTETDVTEAMAQTVDAPPRRAAAPVDTPEENAAPVTAPIPWLNVQKFPDPIPFAQSATQQKAAAQTQSDDAAAAATSGNAAPERVIDPPIAVPNRPAPSADSNATSSCKRAAASAASASPPRTAGPCNCPHRSHVCSADDHVRGARDCRPCPALCRATPPARGRKLPAAAMGARGCPECADTAHSRDAAAVRRETPSAYADQAA